MLLLVPLFLIILPYGFVSDYDSYRYAPITINISTEYDILYFFTSRSVLNQIGSGTWQSYIDDQLIATQMISKAVIAGHDGHIWAKSTNFEITVDEIRAILSNIGSNSQFPQTGVTVEGVQYMYLSRTDRVVRAKRGTSGVHIIKTTQAIIICTYEDPIVPEQAATVTEKLGDYLISVGY